MRSGAEHSKYFQLAHSLQCAFWAVVFVAHILPPRCKIRSILMASGLARALGRAGAQQDTKFQVQLGILRICAEDHTNDFACKFAANRFDPFFLPRICVVHFSNKISDGEERLSQDRFDHSEWQRRFLEVTWNTAPFRPNLLCPLFQ